MMSKKVLVSFIAISLLVLSMVNFASAISGIIGNARMVLYPKIGISGTTLERTILVKNENTVELNISLKTDENFSKIAKVIDSGFILPPGENKEARFRITIKEEGDYEGKIFVYFTPVETGKAGVALASTIIVHARKNSGTDSGDPIPNDYMGDSGDSTDDSVTGLPVLNSGNSKINPMLLVALIPTLIFACVLAWLMILSSKKKAEKDVKRKTIKRSDRSS